MAMTFCLMLVMAIGMTSCWDHVDEVMPCSQANVQVNLPSGIEGLSVKSQTLTVTNLSTGTKSTYADLKNLSLAEGLYDMVYTAEVTYQSDNGDGESSVQKGRLNGKAENVELTGDQKAIGIETFLSTDMDDFIFEEIFFAGTLRYTGSSYIGDG